ncbi:unnamed protein product [Jaminaea pallidilutea]
MAQRSGRGQAFQAEELESLILSAEQFVQSHTSILADPSHDWHHIQRVRRTALWISGAFGEADPAEPIDVTVVELAALFHDLCDKKLQPAGSSSVPTAGSVLQPWFAAQRDGLLHQNQRRMIIDIVDNVSWSKDQKRREAHRASHGRTDTVEGKDDDAFFAPLYAVAPFNWPEYACVSDADRLDSIGAIGVMRCSAYSAVVSRPLVVDARDAEAAEAEGSALAHFHDKLLKIRGSRLRTEAARKEAELRQETMRYMLQQLQREQSIVEQS